MSKDFGLSALKGTWLLDSRSADAAVVDAFMLKWQNAVSAHDAALIAAIFAPEFTFRSPAVHSSYTSMEPVLIILDGILKILPDFAYRAVSFGRLGGQLHLVLEFDGSLVSVEGKKMRLNGADFITLNSTGLIVDFSVMIRPHSALTAVMQLQKKHIEAAMAGGRAPFSKTSSKI
jgi:hypothetical protein